MTEPKRRPGAPRGSQNRLKGERPASCNLNIRLQPEDREMIRAKSAAAGMSVTDWILQLARNAT